IYILTVDFHDDRMDPNCAVSKGRLSSGRAVVDPFTLRADVRISMITTSWLLMDRFEVLQPYWLAVDPRILTVTAALRASEWLVERAVLAMDERDVSPPTRPLEPTIAQEARNLRFRCGLN